MTPPHQWGSKVTRVVYRWKSCRPQTITKKEYLGNSKGKGGDSPLSANKQSKQISNKIPVVSAINLVAYLLALFVWGEGKSRPILKQYPQEFWVSKMKMHTLPWLAIYRWNHRSLLLTVSIRHRDITKLFQWPRCALIVLLAEIIINLVFWRKI